MFNHLFMCSLGDRFHHVAQAVLSLSVPHLTLPHTGIAVLFELAHPVDI